MSEFKQFCQSSLNNKFIRTSITSQFHFKKWIYESNPTSFPWSLPHAQPKFGLIEQANYLTIIDKTRTTKKQAIEDTSPRWTYAKHSGRRVNIKWHTEHSSSYIYQTVGFKLLRIVLHGKLGSPRVKPMSDSPESVREWSTRKRQDKWEDLHVLSLCSPYSYTGRFWQHAGVPDRTRSAHTPTNNVTWGHSCFKGASK